MFDKLKAPDVFAAPRYKEEQITSVVSKVGTVIACSLLFALSIVQLIKYGKAESSISPSTIPRNTSLEMGIPAVAVIVFSDGKEFYDPSVMRILFQYRVIYYGNARKDEEQFQAKTYDIPSQTCKAFYELGVYEDKTVPTNRLLNVTEVSGGKTAQHGCPDFLAADEVLKQARLDGVLGVREGGHLQGKYGEPMYYWLQPRIQACPDYGPKLGIECKNESYVDSLFEKGMTVDIVTLDQLSPESFTWGNIYVTLDKTRWSGYEIFMKPIVHIEEDKNLPSVYYPVSSTFGKLDYWDVRSEPRFDPSDPFLTLYIRMSGLINKNYVKYYSLEDALTKIGSWERILWMIVGTICIYYNLKSVSKEEENLVMSAPFVMDETNADQVMDVEEAHERLSSINPNTHQAKLLRRALSVQSQSRSAERRASIQSNSSMKSSSILQHLRAHVTEAKNHLGHDNLHSHPHQQHVGGMQQQQQLKGMLLNPDLCEAGPDVHVSLANGVSASRLASDASDRQTRNIKPPGSPILKHRKPMVAATSEAGLSKDFLPKHVAYSEAAPSAADGHYHAHPATNGANGISHHSPVPNQGHGLHSANGYSAAAQLLPPPVFGGGDAINGVNGASLYCAPAMDVSRSAPLPNYACAANGSFAAPQGHEGVGPVASEQRELMYRAISPDGAVHVSTAPAAAPHGAGGGGATLMVSPGWQAAAHPRGVDIDGGAAVDERFTEAGGGSHQWA